MKKKKYQLKITIYGYDVGTAEETARLVGKQLYQLKLIFKVDPVPMRLPTKTKTATVLISPHKYKDSQEHFRQLTHKRAFFIYSKISSSDLKSLEELKVPNSASFTLKTFF